MRKFQHISSKDEHDEYDNIVHIVIRANSYEIVREIANEFVINLSSVDQKPSIKYNSSRFSLQNRDFLS